MGRESDVKGTRDKDNWDEDRTDARMDEQREGKGEEGRESREKGGEGIATFPIGEQS